jgi:hypothetical protein
MVYRPQEGPVASQTAQLPPVKTIYYNWDFGADFLGVLSETMKVFAMLFMVRLAFHTPIPMSRGRLSTLKKKKLRLDSLLAVRACVRRQVQSLSQLPLELHIWRNLALVVIHGLANT